jgi:hypothetical protein
MKGLDVWGQIWPSTPKVHQKVKTAILKTISLDATYETIIHMVCLNMPNADVEDQIATARAIRDNLAIMRVKAATDNMPGIG